MAMRYGSRPFEVIFDDITSGPRAESRAHRGVPDDELHEWHTPALLGGGDAAPVVDAERIEPAPDRSDLPPSSNAERAGSAGRRTYTIRDFERSEARSESHRSGPPRSVLARVVVGFQCFITDGAGGEFLVSAEQIGVGDSGDGRADERCQPETPIAARVRRYR